MKSKLDGFALVGFGCLVLAAALIVAQTMVDASQAGPDPQTHKGLELSVSGIARATNVSLGDCPPGANRVRGVVRPGDDSEFVTVTLDITVLPSFEPTIVRSPMMHDESGKAYRTAQAFTDLDREPSYSCEFSFRVAPGTKIASLMIEDVTFDLSTLEP